MTCSGVPLRLIVRSGWALLVFVSSWVQAERTGGCRLQSCICSRGGQRREGRSRRTLNWPGRDRIRRCTREGHGQLNGRDVTGPDNQSCPAELQFVSFGLILLVRVSVCICNVNSNLTCSLWACSLTYFGSGCLFTSLAVICVCLTQLSRYDGSPSPARKTCSLRSIVFQENHVSTCRHGVTLAVVDGQTPRVARGACRGSAILPRIGTKIYWPRN